MKDSVATALPVAASIATVSLSQMRDATAIATMIIGCLCTVWVTVRKLRKWNKK